MPRFSLRNQHKIESHYDKKILARILLSLKKGFEGKIVIHESEPHPLIDVNDTGHTCGLIIFHVISINFDVYNLAFKEFIS